MGWGFQKTAIANTVASLEENSRAQLIMACGTGKTRVGLKVSEKLSHRRILVLVPSIALVEQTLDMYEKYAREGYQALAVCSESQIRFMGVNFENRATTDRTEVEKFMRRKGKKIVVCTYQSQELLQGMRFDLGIFDEAHKTVGPADKAFAFALYDSNVFIRKRLFMTATPRRNIRPHRKGTVVTHDMMNKKLYGDVAYNMPFRKAVRLGVICDYKIVVSVVLDDHLRVEGTPRPLAVSMAQSMDKTKAKKVFSYHYRVDHAQNFIRHNLSAFDQTTMFHINGHQKMRERRKLMDQFKAAKRAIMTNARCLIEGVNVPAVDMVAFTHAKRSEVDIVQAVGRAMRIDSARKTTGYIYLPLFLSSYEPVEDALQRTRFDYLYEVMAAMRDQDEVFAQHLVNFTARGTGSLPQIVIDSQDSRLSVEHLKRVLAARILSRSSRQSPDVRKAEVLVYAKADPTRPRPKRVREHKTRPDYTPKQREEARISDNLSRYAGRKGPRFDQEFRDELERVVPHWFEKTSDRNKRLLIERAKAGLPKPSPKSEKKLYDVYHHYVTPSLKCYDEEFCKKLFAIAPEWKNTVYTKAAAKKTKLLERAIQGGKSPSKPREPSLYLALRRFTTPGTDTYDAEFYARIYVARPDWFQLKHTHPSLKNRREAKKWLKEHYRIG